MPKIKDLAVIAVDNAFVLFPIDQERYELLTALGHFLSHPDDYRDGRKTLQVADERVKRWIQMVDESLTVAACSFRMVVDHPRAQHDHMTQDRARRCQATLRFWVDELRWSRILVACPDVLIMQLWGAIVRCLASTHAGPLPIRLRQEWLVDWEKGFC